MKHTTTKSSKRRAVLIGAVAAAVLGIGTTAYACDGGGFGGGGFGGGGDFGGGGGFGSLTSMMGFGGGDEGFGDCGGGGACGGGGMGASGSCEGGGGACGGGGMGASGSCEGGGGACGGGGMGASGSCSGGACGGAMPASRPQGESKKRGMKKWGIKKESAPMGQMPGGAMGGDDCTDEDFDNFQQVSKDKANGTFLPGGDDYSDMVGEQPMKPGGCNEAAVGKPSQQMPVAEKPKRKHKKKDKPVDVAPVAQIPSEEPVVVPSAPAAQPAPQPVAKPAPAQEPAGPSLPNTGVDTKLPLQIAGGLIVLGAGVVVVNRRRRATR